MQRMATQGRPASYLVSPESGALGFSTVALLASRLGLAVVDADGAGRAVPELPMLTFYAGGVSPRPAILANGLGVCVELAEGDWDAGIVTLWLADCEGVALRVRPTVMD
jgi:DUF917 family protein